MRIGIIAGEASGDILAAGLIKAFLEYYPHAQFEGIAGPLMIKAGCTALYPSEKLSVMGIVEVLSHYKELSKIRRNVIAHFIHNPPDVFIGVDAPDFNLYVESSLKKAGIGTIHYVSPSVWAWRQYRVAKIARAVDLMLTLFPFEARFYENHHISVNYIGHTLADQIEPNINIQSAREKIKLELSANQSVIAVLPGSRMSEVSRLTQPFIDTMLECLNKQPNIIFMLPFVNQKTYRYFQQALILKTESHPDIRTHFKLFHGQSRNIMAASDAVLLASGTAALEALLLKKPMLVAYKLSPITYFIAKHLLKVPYYSLPNLLAGDALVEEITQDDVQADILAPKVLNLLLSDLWKNKLEIFHDIHQLLRQNADQSAVQSVIKFLKEHHKLS